MRTKYVKGQLMKFSNEEILDRTKGRAVDFHLTDGRWTQLCVNDLQGFDEEGAFFYTKTGIRLNLQDIDYIEIIKND